jgi:Thiolase, C-terminal domain
MSSAKREQPTVLRWDDVVELVRRGNVAPPRRVTFPFPQKGRPAGAHADVGAGQSANLVSLGPIDRAKLNPKGGSVALGHPFGATGARIVGHFGETARGKRLGPRADFHLHRWRNGCHGVS